MKCFHCGAEIEDGSITCSHCGNPLEVVTDIFSENEVLVEEHSINPDIPDEDKQDASEETASVQNDPDTDKPDEGSETEAVSKDPNMIEKKKMYIILGIICGVFLILLILMAIFWRKPKKEEEVVVEEITYQDVLDRISADFNHQDYGDALDGCEEALSFGECDEYFIYRLYLDIYRELGRDDSCISTLEMLKEFAVTASKADDLSEWYEELLEIYSKRDDTYNIGVLINEIESCELEIDKNSLLAPFVPAEPVFSAVPTPAYPGDYIYITSPDGSNIFMGKISKKNAGDPYLSLYHGEGLMLKAGRNEYAAVCENQYGLKSAVVNFSYILETVYDIDMPTITPESGEYKEETFVEIDVPFSYKAYYCWDGDPDTSSTEYTEPIEMEEGNHVFSAILEDKYGNVSNIQRMNYIYIPEKDPEEEEEGDKPLITVDDPGKDDGGGGSNIIKDADDTPEYHGRVTEPEKEEPTEHPGGNTVSGNGPTT